MGSENNKKKIDPKNEDHKSNKPKSERSKGSSSSSSSVGHLTEIIQQARDKSRSAQRGYQGGEMINI